MTETNANPLSKTAPFTEPQTCIVVGGSTLAIHCVSRLRELGYVVSAVLPTDEIFDQWAKSEALRRITTVDQLSSLVHATPADWLFSIVNPILLPASLLSYIRKGSFNYHDAPLPRYAGSHATSWALLALESEYAITWHRIDQAVDAGDVVVQRAVDITGTDTALSLNLKCYVAACLAFDELLSELTARGGHSHPQNLALRTFFARDRRPDAASFLQWQESAKQLSATVRALDFGDRYFNPLALPKILLAGSVVGIGALEVLDVRSGSSPGTIVALNAEGWRITTGSQDVLVKHFRELEGASLDPLAVASNANLHEGSKLDLLSAEQVSVWTNVCQALARHESFWMNRLMRASPQPLPYQVRSRTPTSPLWQYSTWTTFSVLEDLPPADRIDRVLAALFVYLARITGESEQHVGWSTRSSDAKFSSVPPQLFARVVPMVIALDLGRTFNAICDDVVEERAQLERKLTFAVDLIGRHPRLRKRSLAQASRPWPVAAAVVDDHDGALASMSEVEDAADGGVLTLQMCARDGSFRWMYDAGSLSLEWIERITRHLSNLLCSAADRETVDSPAALLDILSSDERQLLLHDWNDTAQPFPHDRCVHQLFEEQVARAPEAIALVFEDQQLSYAQLNRRANQLAHYLRQCGVKPDARVAICVERGFEMVIGLLAVLKAGGAYVPMDPAYPVERLRFMLDDAAPVVVLTQSHLAALFDQHAPAAPVLLLDGDTAAWSSQPDENLDPHALHLAAHHLAYVIYTSGSTGTPKGVMVEHRGVVNMVGAQIAAFDLDASSRVLQFASLSFDACAWEIFGTLCRGASLYVKSQETLLSSLQSTLDMQVTHVTLSPAVLAALPEDAALAAVKTLIVAGEALPGSLANRWSRGRLLINAYGPTEVTVCATLYPCNVAQPGSVPIGRPITNARVYILDQQGELVPMGVAGELYIGGAGVARGYLNRPELTAERFLSDPFAAEPDARMYRTGDLGRWLHDGNIEFLGRNDFQVKIRGFRIELGEIEARLTEHPAIHTAVVLAREDQPGDKRLVAYYVTEAEHDEPDLEALRSHLAGTLAEYMVPAAYVRLPALPLTPNGKLDRNALPAPDADAYSVQDYAPPQGDTEILLAALFAEVLKCERVGRHDNFFELGGHSLSAVTLIERIRQSGVQTDVRTLFATPTVARLAAAVPDIAPAVPVPPNGIPAGCSVLTPAMLPLVKLSFTQIESIVARIPGAAVNVQDIYPLTPLQEGILFHHLMAEHGDPYLLSSLAAFNSREQLDRYLGAMQSVVNRHDILRTSILWEGLPEPVQVVRRKAVLRIEEVALDTNAGDASDQLHARFDPRHYRIDLREAPLLRFFIAYDAARERWLMLELLHHMAGDHTTLDILQEEIHAHLLGREQELPAPLPFRNLVAQARLGISNEQHETFFKNMLGDIDEPTAPFGLLQVQGDGTGIAQAQLDLEAALSERIRAHARRLGVSAASLCHLAWALVLARVTGRQSVVFGTVLFGRMHGGDGADRVTGPFINTLPLRVDLADQNVVDSVRRTQLLLAELLHHEHASLAFAQRCSGVKAPAPLFSSLFNYRHSAQPVLGEAGDGSGMHRIRTDERSNYPLILSVDDLGVGFRLVAQVEAAIDPARVCAFMQAGLASLVGALERAPGHALRDLDVLPPDERQLLLHDWNDTAQPFPHDRCVHQLFEEQVARAPEAIALVFEDQQLSYAQLNRRANQLAHYLRQCGVKPDARVAICVERGFEMVIGLLAVLKAGGAYVPMDPAYPVERLRFMLDDAAPVVVLTQSHLAALFDQHAPAAPVLLLDGDTAAWSSQPDENLDPHALHLAAHHLAYVIYTSGSTGTPKGVMVEHRGVVNRLVAANAELGFAARDVLPNLASQSFDISLLELLLPLVNGGITLLLARGHVRDLAKLIAISASATFFHAVPSLMDAWLSLLGVEGARRQYPALRTLLVGGEAVPEALVLKLAAHFPRARIMELYGPTEATIFSTARKAHTASKHPVSHCIGRPIANTTIHILDLRGKLAPVGVAGELYIGGAGVARGYLNRPELTAERFLSDPFAAEPDARMYRTGDLGRWLHDGNIEFLGRNDFQVKIRGFRIELGEIEARLTEHPAIHTAVVLAREDQPGDKRLVAYYVTEAEHDEPDLEALRSHLAGTLAEYMVPAAYVRLPALPLTPNGKLDRNALPAPDADAYSVQDYAPPQGDTEILLAALFAEVLKCERVGRHDNFFELGGHSLSAVQLMSRIRHAVQLEVRVAEIFAHPTPAALSSRLDGAARTQLPAITAADRNQPLPLSFAQQRLWFLAQMDDGISQAYHIPFGLRLDGELHRRALRHALDQIVARHEALRTAFVTLDGSPTQHIVPLDQARFHLLEHDLRQHRDPQRALQELCMDEANQRFDLERGPLIRGRLLHLDDDQHMLLITMHHVVSDGWSMGVFLQELSTLYSACRKDLPDPLPPLALQYADYAIWQRRWIEGPVLEEQAAFWQGHLAGAPQLLELPTDYPRPAQQDYAGASVELLLDASLTRALKALGKRHGATLYMTLMAAWAILLSRLSGQQDLVIGTPSANRNHREIEGLIGFFVNTLALRFDLDDAPSVSQFLERVKTSTLTAQQHQDIPFEQVVERVKPLRSLAYSPLFQVMFAWQSAPPSLPVLPGLAVEALTANPYRVAKFDLTLSLMESGETIAGGIEYATALFDAPTIERYIRYFHTLLHAMVAEPAQSLEHLPMLPPDERQLLLHDWNDTAQPFPHDRCVHQLFEEQVARAPEAIALVFEDQQLSYAQLNRRANQLAHYLRQCGVKPDARVAICVERGFEMVIGLLAVLKAGGAYVPMDPAYPVERLRFMLDDAAPVVVLTQSHLAALFDQHAPAAPVLLLDGDTAAWSSQPDENLDPHALHLAAHHLAYVIYTSGSTGTPKGVMVEHRGVVNMVGAQIAAFDLDASSRVLQFASLSFDACAWEIFGTLCRGASLYVKSQETLLSSLQSTLDMQVTHVTLSPAVLAALPEDAALAAVKTLIVAGEALPGSLANRWSRGRLLINAYGPTEVTVCATLYPCNVAQPGSVPIGRPITNARVYILDQQGELVPMGVAGELYIGGAGVARGYLNRPELTAERFLSDPFAAEPDARMYRTGDLGRWLHDGNIEFLGRNDFQVKIRGFRIELGEIEARLTEHPAIHTAVVLAREDQPGDKRLVAYYVTEAEHDEPDLEALRSHLAGTLAEYMVPAAYVRLPALPLTPNGKLDRNALPAPDADAYSVQDYAPPQGDTEILLAALFAEVLKCERVGRHDNFFELGGHSLSAVQLMSRIRHAVQLEVRVAEIFAHPTPAALSSRLDGAARTQLPAITAADRNQPLPLSFAQQRLWFLAQMDDGISQAYHIPFGLRLDGELHRRALRHALDQIVARHEALRTAFVTLDGSPTQHIVPLDQARFHLLEHDLRQHRDPQRALQELCMDEANQRFDLERGPLIRGRLLHLDDDQHMLLITMHHVVSDGWSMGVFLQELSTLYSACRKDLPDPLPPLALQYADYAIWQRRWIEGPVLEEQAAFWQGHLAGAPQLLELPTDYPRPAQQDYAGASVELLLDASLTRALKALGKRHGATLYMTLMAAWAILLSRLSGQQDLVIGTPSANRNHREIEGLIGFFVNTLALRFDLDDAPSVSQFLERVKTSTLTAQQHQDIPFEQVVERVKPLRSLAYSPLFQVMFAWQSAPPSLPVLPGLAVEALTANPYRVAKFDLTLSLMESGETIAGGIEYATALFDAPTIERYIRYFHTLLHAMVAEPAQSLEHLPMLPPDERQLLLHDWNDTAQPFPHDRCVHQLFEEQVARAPEAIALVFEDQQLSYAQLNRRANQLAHYLRQCGVKPDARVAICVERGFEMVIGLLAVLKAGGAYVPMDPAYPVERLRFMLDDAAPVVVLTQSHLAALFDQHAPAAPVLLLDGDTAAWSSQPDENLDPHALHLAAHHLAYVIYTSGSTGTPKGVMVEHRNVTRLFYSTEAWFQFTHTDVWTLFHSFAFDFSVWEIWGALLYGGQLIVVPLLVARSPQAFYDLLSQRKVTILNQTPSAFRQLISTQGDSLKEHCLRHVIFGGEALDTTLLDPWYERQINRQCRLINMYGITETTVHATYRELADEPARRQPGSSIGQRLPDLRIYLLDRYGRPAPVGVEGELYIGGAGVARGYLNQPALTAERFLSDTFASIPGARMFRTGDLGRWLPDGSIEFLGRNDFQVKIRGFRIELGEIEARLGNHPAVREAVVLAREDEPGDKRLVAYYVTDTQSDNPGVDTLRGHLSGALPEHMVPAAYVRLPALPLTPNGKLDRNALPAPDADAYSVQDYAPPQGDTEILLAALFAEVLKCERVGRHDNFFELGGHSLSAVTLIERIRQSGMHADVRTLFLTRTLAELAAAIEYTEITL